MSENYHLLVHLFLMGLLVFTEVRNFLERKNIMDRLMSRDFTDYTSNEIHRDVLSKQKKAPHEELIEL